jgi:hypothetical protein
LARELLAIGSASCARLTWFGVLWYANAVPGAAGLNMAQRVLSSAVLHRPPMPGNEHVRHTASSTLTCRGVWVWPEAQLGKRTTLAAAAPVHNTPTPHCKRKTVVPTHFVHCQCPHSKSSASRITAGRLSAQMPSCSRSCQQQCFFRSLISSFTAAETAGLCCPLLPAPLTNTGYLPAAGTLHLFKLSSLHWTCAAASAAVDIALSVHQCTMIQYC